MDSSNAEKAWTTGQVRETFVRGREQHADFPGINNARAEFESWLAAHDAEVLASRDAEVGVLREQLAAAEAVIEKVREAAKENASDGELFYSTFHVDRALALVPSSVLAAVKADVWDQGKSAWADYVWRLDDADAAGQGVMITSPNNPYRSGTEGSGS